MSAKSEFSTPSATEIMTVRRFAGDRDRIWAMWTQARHLRHWWGPTGWTIPICEVDFRPGGTWFYCLQDPDGNRYCSKTIYGEIDAPRRFTSVEVFTDEAGKLNDELPAGRNRFTFAETDGATTVTGLTRYPSPEARDQIIEMGVEAGIKQTFARLDAYLATLKA